MANSFYNMADSLNGMRDAAIESTMHLLGIGGTVSGGFDGGSPPVRVSPLGGRYEGSTFVNGGRVTDPTGQYAATIPIGPEWPFHDLPSMMEYYNNRINELFSDWWQIPQDRDFEGLVQQCGQGAQLLASEAQLSPGTGSAAPFGANVNLSQIATIQQQIGRFDGAAMQTFAANYANRLPIVVDGQDAVACFLWLGVAGEQEIWKRAMQGVADIAAQGRTAMEQCDDGGGDASGGAHDRRGAGVDRRARARRSASLVKLAWHPPEHGVEVRAQGLRDGPARRQQPDHRARQHRGRARQAEQTDRRRGERAGQRTSSQVQDVVTSQSASFDIAAPTIYDDTNADNFRTADDTRVHFGTLRTIARETMPMIAGEIRKAAGQFDGTNTSDAWSRPSGIGSGTPRARTPTGTRSGRRS